MRRAFIPFGIIVLSIIFISCLTGGTAVQDTRENPSTPLPEIQGHTPSSHLGPAIAGRGSLSGTVRLSGEVPPVEILKVTRNVNYCGEIKKSKALLVGKGGGVANVVIQIFDVPAGRTFIKPEKIPSLDQMSCSYVPHIQIIPLGSKLEIYNSDPILHNVHAFLNGRRTIFNVAMPLKNQKIIRTLSRPGTIRLQCDAGHTWMSAYIIVAENPYYALTDELGHFEITDIPAGSYRIGFWHEKLGQKDVRIKIEEGHEASLDIDFRAN